MPTLEMPDYVFFTAQIHLGKLDWTELPQPLKILVRTTSH
jgi:hypothetical protein